MAACLAISVVVQLLIVLVTGLDNENLHNLGQGQVGISDSYLIAILSLSP